MAATTNKIRDDAQAGGKGGWYVKSLLQLQNKSWDDVQTRGEEGKRPVRPRLLQMKVGTTHALDVEKEGAYQTSVGTTRARTTDSLKVERVTGQIAATTIK
jgi:hypothetical protein